MRQPLEIPPLTAEEVEALDTLYRSTKDVRVRTRAQIILLAGEQRMIVPTIAKVVRTDDQTVHNWFKRWRAEGIEGLKDRPMPERPAKVTKA
jgi:transposase